MLLMLEIDERKLRPNVITYNSVVTSLAQGSRWDLAFDVLMDMKGKKTLPREITYNTVLQACRSANQTELVEKLLQEMKQTEQHA